MKRKWTLSEILGTCCFLQFVPIEMGLLTGDLPSRLTQTSSQTLFAPGQTRSRRMLRQSWVFTSCWDIQCSLGGSLEQEFWKSTYMTEHFTPWCNPGLAGPQSAQTAMSQGQQSSRKLQIVQYQMPAVSSVGWDGASGPGCKEMEGVACCLKCRVRWSKWTWMQGDGGGCLCPRICWACSQAGKRSRDVHEASSAGLGVGAEMMRRVFWGNLVLF